MKRTGNKVVLTVFILAAICFILAFRFFSSPHRVEPLYKGRTLSEWLEQLDDGQVLGISSAQIRTDTPQQLEAANAICAMGSKALPRMMEDIHARSTKEPYRLRLRRWARSHFPSALDLPFLSVDITPEDETRWRAAQGLAALGPMAAPAVPELKRLFYTNFYHSSIKEAAFALAAIGPEGVEILTNSLQPRNEWSGMCAIWALGQHPAAGTNVIPFFIRATTSSSEGTACGAIQVLGLFQVDSEHVVPALCNALTNSNRSVQRDAAQALGRFGRQAVSALPLLGSLTNDTYIRGPALQALKRIQ